MVVQLAPAGRPVQAMIGLEMVAMLLIWNVIVVEPDPPAVTVTLLGEAVSVTVMWSPALTGLNSPTTNSKIKPIENSKTLSLTNHATQHHSSLQTFKTDKLEVRFRPKRLFDRKMVQFLMPSSAFPHTLF